MKKGVFVILALTILVGFAIPPNLPNVINNSSMIANNVYGIFQHQISIGEPAVSGTVSYESETQEYTLEGSGVNVWADKDEFQYLYKSIQGDFILRAQLRFIGEGVDPHRKIGWIIRNNLQGNSRQVNAAVHGDGLTSLQFRRHTGGETEQVVSTDEAPDVVQLERRAGVYYMSTAKFGKPFTIVKIEDVNLKNEVFVGLYICSHNPDVLEKAVFSNVRIIKPAAPDFRPYQDYIGSNMEVMNVETGYRKILFTSAHSIQAPNWINNDLDLVFNSNGYLYNYSFETSEISTIETGFAVNNNNDHVFSFDETILGISNHNQDDNRASSIYIMNPKGDSIPKKITKDGVGNSYLHSISPDNKNMLFTAQRKGKYDIYSVDIESGKEVQITDTKDLDDGSEYSPDGKYIYFNSNRTGNMHLWRMKADGSQQEQMTNDPGYKDWFPHVSPDGKWIVFISFPPTIPFGEHPFYKHCTIRLMPTNGGEPKIIGYVYGGQGTMNVPSWSKDSKHIAFVSNSD